MSSCALGTLDGFTENLARAIILLHVDIPMMQLYSCGAHDLAGISESHVKAITSTSGTFVVPCGYRTALNNRVLSVRNCFLAVVDPTYTFLSSSPCAVISQGKHSEAKRLHEREGQISEKVHVPDHSTSTATLVLLVAYLTSTWSACST